MHLHLADRHCRRCRRRYWRDAWTLAADNSAACSEHQMKQL